MGVVKKQGLTNTLVVYLGTVIGAFSLLWVQPNLLTKEELGLTRLILSFGTVLASVLSFGISSVTVRYLPRVFGDGNGHRGFLGFMLMYVSTSVGLGTIVLFLFRGSFASFYDGEAGIFEENLRYVVILSISYSFILGLNAYSLALMRTVFPTVLNDIIVRLMFIVVIAAHFLGYMDLRDFLTAFCGIYVIQALVMLGYVLWVDRPGFVPDIAHLHKTIGIHSILRYGAIITFTAINSVTLKYLDSIFVGNISVEQVAIYSVAAFIGLIVEIPLMALERVANPAIAHAMANKDLSPVRTIYLRSSRFLLLLGGWMFAMVVLNARDVLGFLPDGYSEGWSVAVIISLGALVNMATGVNHPILVNSDKYIYSSIFLVVLLAITVTGNCLLIPRMGMLGAAITACGASVLYNALKFAFIRKHFGMQPFDHRTFAMVAAIAIATAVAWWMPLPGSPEIRIIIRAVVASVILLLSVHRFRLASDLNEYLPAFLRKWIA